MHWTFQPFRKGWKGRKGVEMHPYSVPPRHEAAALNVREQRKSPLI